jgi:hypothetical protein
MHYGMEPPEERTGYWDADHDEDGVWHRFWVEEKATLSGDLEEELAEDESALESIVEIR